MSMNLRFAVSFIDLYIYAYLRVLSLGLKFTPNPPHVDRLNLKESLHRFDRNLRLREYFRGF